MLWPMSLTQPTDDMGLQYSFITLLGYPCLKRSKPTLPKKKKLFFFFGEGFNLWRSLLIIALYHQIKISIGFWYKGKLNFKSLNKTLNFRCTCIWNKNARITIKATSCPRGELWVVNRGVNVVKHKNNEKYYVHNIFTTLLKQILIKIKWAYF